jgi:sugar/nucleoside kinase (ribokinase family)
VMIAVVGLPAWAGTPDGEGSAGGPAVDIAVAAHRRGAAVELVGKVGDDGAGDAVVVSLGRLGIGHAALLRDPTRPTPVIAPPDAAAE